jgi:hypothetical protein
MVKWPDWQLVWLQAPTMKAERFDGSTLLEFIQFRFGR